MSKQNHINDLIAAAPNRRSFVRKLGIASAALGAAGASRAWGQTGTAAITDVDILNFALNLEYLEAEFYTFATTGGGVGAAGISVAGKGTSGQTTGGSMVQFTDPKVQAVAAELAHDEQTHVTLLQGTISGLGGNPVAKPAINLGALGIGFGSQSDFLTLARAFEDIGVTAYGGAAPLISNKSILGYAARILAVEAFHSGSIRLLVAQNSISVTPLDGVDHVPPPAGMLYFNTNSSALSEVRSPGEVLFLAYGGKANATGGGFFPNGVNGLINTASGAAASPTSGAELSANPNPIQVTGGATQGATTITFNAPSQSVQLRAFSPNGFMLYQGTGSGSVSTGPYLTDGTVIYLQDTSNGLPLTAANTLATLTIHLQSA